MPVTMGETVVMGDDGVFTSDFKPSMLGEDYAESKFFETTPDLPSLMKSAADSKSALGKKLENVIQRPGKDASEEDITAFRGELRSELGAGKSIDDYAFSPLEGRTHDEELTKVFKEVFHKLGVSVDTATQLVATFDTFQQAQEEALIAQSNQLFKEEVDAYTKSHPGDALAVGTRTAAKAVIEFSDIEFVGKIKKANLLSDSSNFDAWRKLGITPVQLSIFENIGTKMKSDLAISSEGLPNADQRTPEEKSISTHYDHPTSVADREQRAAATR